MGVRTLKKYETCVKNLGRLGLTRRQIGKITGVDEAVISRRMSGKQEPTHEAVVWVNVAHELYTDVNMCDAVLRSQLPQTSVLRTMAVNACNHSGGVGGVAAA